MNYRHIYHAGNFADVFKHWILTLILIKLCAKDAPFCLIDTHAGLGTYALDDPQAVKTKEAESGVNRILNKQLNEDFEPYQNIVKQYLNGYAIYPGSPAIMSEFLRSSDRLILSELHPEDYVVLHDYFKRNKQVKILQQDGYTSIKALLPPIERRGLILIDPPFEQTNEFEQIINGLKEGLKRFATGIYAVWYPIKDRKQIANFYKDLRNITQTEILAIEIHANESILNQLNSCGMIIVNPPWQLYETLQANLPKLLEYLDFNNGTYNLSLL
jgi:23S rRNA (adenine2030-N6)-methyltransferase